MPKEHQFQDFYILLTDDSMLDVYRRRYPRYGRFVPHLAKFDDADQTIVDVVANVGYGGHIARRPDARIYPVRFIHKHYPVRSLEHGRRKILQERKQRFSTAEKQRGWHVQYDQMDDVRPEDVFWTTDKLARFEMQPECLRLLDEGADVACQLLSAVRTEELDAFIERSLVERFSPSPFTPEHARQLLGVSRQLLGMAGKGPVPPIQSAPDDLEYIRCALQLLASRHWLTGDASIFQRIAAINLQTP